MEPAASLLHVVETCSIRGLKNLFTQNLSSKDWFYWVPAAQSSDNIKTEQVLKQYVGISFHRCLSLSSSFLPAMLKVKKNFWCWLSQILLDESTGEKANLFLCHIGDFVYILQLYRKNCIQSIQCCISRRSKTAKINCYKL